MYDAHFSWKSWMSRKTLDDTMMWCACYYVHYTLLLSIPLLEYLCILNTTIFHFRKTAEQQLFIFIFHHYFIKKIWRKKEVVYGYETMMIIIRGPLKWLFNVALKLPLVLFSFRTEHKNWAALFFRIICIKINPSIPISNLFFYLKPYPARNWGRTWLLPYYPFIFKA